MFLIRNTLIALPHIVSIRRWKRLLLVRVVGRRLPFVFMFCSTRAAIEVEDRVRCDIRDFTGREKYQ